MTDTTAPLDLDAIEARANAATSGPWYQGRDGRRYESSHEVFTREDMYDAESRDAYPQAARSEDAEFIAHAREDVPALVAAVRERDEMLAKISAAVAAGTYSNRELREAIQYIANVVDRTDAREPRVMCFCGGEHITGTCLASCART